jgi:hypothetical protein
VEFESYLVEHAPVDRAATFELARRGRRFLLKSGDGIVRRHRPLGEGEVTTYLLHEDGFLRVPVLLVDDLVVRGYSEELYEEALASVRRA